MKRPRRALTAGLAVLAAVAVPAGTATASPHRASFTALEAQLMCTSCHEPLELVNSPQAVSEKDYLRSLVDQGLTSQQILNQMVQNYGVAVLAKPPAHGFNLTIYILPPALLAGGIVFLLITLPKWRERTKRMAPLESAPELSATDAQRIDEDLARLI